MNHDDEIELEKRLKRMSGQGVDLYLEGKPVFSGGDREEVFCL